MTMSAPGLDLAVSSLTALVVEVPLACSLLLVSRRARRIMVDLSRGIVPTMHRKR